MIDFAFASCLPGIERAVKLDVARRRPELRFAFSRPGLCTFKSDRAVAPDDPPGTVFARVWGRSLGPANDQAAAVRSLAGSGVNRVHVFARDPEAALDLDPWRAGLETIAPVGRASAGELVADVIVAEGEPSFLGLHRADGDHLPEPGGAIPIEMPPDAPSRAYAKIEEAIAWLGLPLAAGQTAVELGSAPGGAALALARRGIEVWGVDPAAMAPHVLAYRHANGARVHHLATKIGALRWEQLPKQLDWLLCDVNLAPQVVVHELLRIARPFRASLQAAVINLKLNDWAFVADLPKLEARIAEILPIVRMRHLPSNRREICAVARR